MPDDTPFDELMSRLRAGDEGVAEEVFRRFARRLIALARSRLDGLARQKVDPEDVLQSVFRSFFGRQAAGEFDLASWDSVWSLLTLITLRKCGLQLRRFRTGRRDARRETSTSGRDGAGWEAIAREPNPSEAAMLAETVEQLMAALDPRDRQVVELTMQGVEIPEVSGRLAISERSVYRTLERVRRRLEVMIAEPDGAG